MFTKLTYVTFFLREDFNTGDGGIVALDWLARSNGNGFSKLV